MLQFCFCLSFVGASLVGGDWDCGLKSSLDTRTTHPKVDPTGFQTDAR